MRYGAAFVMCAMAAAGGAFIDHTFTPPEQPPSLSIPMTHAEAAALEVLVLETTAPLNNGLTMGEETQIDKLYDDLLTFEQTAPHEPVVRL